MPTAGMMYKDLLAESRALDGLLYNVLLMNVKGSANTLLECVQHPSYIQGMIVLVKHIDISRSDRKARAFEGVDKNLIQRRRTRLSDFYVQLEL